MWLSYWILVSSSFCALWHFDSPIHFPSKLALFNHLTWGDPSPNKSSLAHQCPGPNRSSKNDQVMYKWCLLKQGSMNVMHCISSPVIYFHVLHVAHLAIWWVLWPVMRLQSVQTSQKLSLLSNKWEKMKASDNYFLTWLRCFLILENEEWAMWENWTLTKMVLHIVTHGGPAQTSKLSMQTLKTRIVLHNIEPCCKDVKLKPWTQLYNQ